VGKINRFAARRYRTWIAWMGIFAALVCVATMTAASISLISNQNLSLVSGSSLQANAVGTSMNSSQSSNASLGASAGTKTSVQASGASQANANVTNASNTSSSSGAGAQSSLQSTVAAKASVDAHAIWTKIMGFCSRVFVSIGANLHL
jgi:hypothetical protein